ncbi:MAG: flavin reductase family protein, partial [Gaiellales bacterium]
MSTDRELKLDFRECVGAFATGVTVVTTQHLGAPAGMTLNSFTSVSLDPLLVLVSLAHNTRTLERIKSSGRYTVNILHRKQRDVALAFAKPGAPFPEGYTVRHMADTVGIVRQIAIHKKHVTPVLTGTGYLAAAKTTSPP